MSWVDSPAFPRTVAGAHPGGLTPSSSAGPLERPPDGLSAPIVIELPSEVEVESAEIRDGKLVVRSRGGEEMVLG
ncbi:MAG: hypothetical protein QXF87_02250 [Thermofilaceae archaeon]